MRDSRLSKRYAKAFFSLGQQDGSFSRYGRELAEFARFCKDNVEFGHAIANPVFSVEERKAVIQTTLAKSDFSGMVKNFLFLLLDKDRMGAIEAISEVYSRLSDEASNIARAEITTVKPLGKKALEKVEKALEALTSKKVRSDVKEDQDIIGGIVVKIGDLVLDGSVKAQLEGLKESFKRGE